MTVNQFPKFICVGSQRAGTTWLYHALSDHPEVFLPDKKELHYFDLNWDKEVSSYLKYFPLAEIKKHKTWGEITPNYYQDISYLERIFQTNNQTKIIYIVREPLERAFSQYQLFSQSKFKGRNFFDAIKDPQIIKLSRQGHHLKNIYSIFPKSNVLLLLFDDLKNNPQSLLTDIYTFLKIDSNFCPTCLNNTINKIVFPKLQNTLVKMKMQWIITLIKHSPFAEKIKKLSTKNEFINISNSEFTKLSEYFHEDVLFLEESLQRDLSHWQSHPKFYENTQ